MAESVLEMAKELVFAQIQAGGISPENISELLSETHHQLLSLKSREESRTQSGTGKLVSPLADWRKSIGKHAVTCLECGASFKQLSPRHLREHNLDKRSYQLKYGIPRTQSLAAKETTARRRAAVQQSRPWERVPGYIATQGSIAQSTKKPATKKKTPAKRKTSAK